MKLQRLFLGLLGMVAWQCAVVWGADFRLPTPAELPGASEVVKGALESLEKKDSVAGFNVLKAAAEEGDRNAQFVLGLCLQYGEGTKPSLDKSPSDSAVNCMQAFLSGN